MSLQVAATAAKSTWILLHLWCGDPHIIGCSTTKYNAPSQEACEAEVKRRDLEREVHRKHTGFWNCSHGQHVPGGDWAPSKTIWNSGR